MRTKEPFRPRKSANLPDPDIIAAEIVEDLQAAYAYRRGNRSALEWVIDQYQTSTDKRSGITNDPNREDEPDYIVKLIGKVITISLETQKLIAALPALTIAGD